MTENEKDLLLKDLCGRLPYGVKGRVSSRDCNNRECEFVAAIDGKLYDRFAVAQELWFDNVIIKPYLFPLSNMTEEEKSQYSFFLTRIIDGYDASLLINWLNKNNFDYRGLIPMGLADDATGKNIY